MSKQRPAGNWGGGCRVVGGEWEWGGSVVGVAVAPTIGSVPRRTVFESRQSD